MKNMFKKTLVAAALASLSTGAIAAELSVNNNAPVVSSQYLETNEALTTADGDITTDRELVVTLGANYTTNDIVKLTFSGESLDVSSLPDTVSDDDGGPNSVTFGLISTSVVDGNIVAVYRVTDVSGDTITLAPNFGTLNFDSAEVQANDGVTVSFEAETNTGLALDTGGDDRSISFVTVVDQFGSYDVSGFSGEIDVEEQRLKFTGTAPADVEDGATFELTGPLDGDGVAIAMDAIADFDGAEFTLTGDFAWMLDEDDDLANNDYVTVTCDAGVTALDNATDVEFTATAISFECAANDEITIDFDITGNAVALETQSFGYESVISYSGADTAGTVDKSGSAGAWTLNGSQVNVSYMPYRHDISQVINLTNRSGQSGAVTVRAFPQDGGDPINLGEVATANANSLTQLTGAIIDGLTAETGVNHRTAASIARYALQITTNAPAEAVEVYSAYNVGGSGARLVVNDSNGGGLSKKEQ